MKKPPENSDGFFALCSELRLLRQCFDIQIELEAAGLLNAEEHPDVYGSSVCQRCSQRDRT